MVAETAATAPAAPAAPAPAAPAPAATALAAPAPAAAASVTKAPDALSIFFDLGSAAIRPGEEATLDKASRLYRDGKPIVMLVSGGTDSVGSAEANLHLSQMRADAVLRALVSRGIPVDRFQVLSKGETDPVIPTSKGTAEPRNRRVEITWR